MPGTITSEPIAMEKPMPKWSRGMSEIDIAALATIQQLSKRGIDVANLTTHDPYKSAWQKLTTEVNRMASQLLNRNPETQTLPAAAGN